MNASGKRHATRSAAYLDDDRTVAVLHERMRPNVAIFLCGDISLWLLGEL
jgi:hypothetical protein